MNLDMTYCTNAGCELKAVCRRAVVTIERLAAGRAIAFAEFRPVDGKCEKLVKKEVEREEN